MAHGKAPGSYGLPMEFFVKFWDVLGLDLIDVLNSCYLSGPLSLSQRRGIISLVFKKGDRLDIRNWRPISLLNVNYKLLLGRLRGAFLKSCIRWLTKIKHVGSLGGSLARMLPLFGMWWTLTHL